MALFLFCLFCVWAAGCYLSAQHVYKTSGMPGVLAETLLIMTVQVLIALCVVVGALGYASLRLSDWLACRKRRRATPRFGLRPLQKQEATTSQDKRSCEVEGTTTVLAEDAGKRTMANEQSD